MRLWLPVAALALSLSLNSPLDAQPNAQGHRFSDSTTAAATPAVKVIDAFHAALERGDARGALAFMSDEALVFEAGGVERGKDEYARQHLGADAAFAKAVSRQLIRRTGSATSTLAWVATEGRVAGSYQGQSIDHITIESMILRLVGAEWKIVHIHWSSAPSKKS